MSLAERLHAALIDAMRSGEPLRRDTIRMAVAAAQNAEKEARRPLTDDELVGVLARQVKGRREAVDAYRAAGREELAAKEEAEGAILAEFLPQPLSQDELRSLVADAIREAGATSPRDLGRVMGLLAPRTRGRADGKAVSGLVVQALAAADLAAHDQRHEGDREDQAAG
jgi:uncharacterized protein YqeY